MYSSDDVQAVIRSSCGLLATVLTASAFNYLDVTKLGHEQDKPDEERKKNKLGWLSIRQKGMVSSVLLSSFCFLGKIEVNRKLTLIDLHILLFPNVFVPFSRPRYCNTTSPAILSMILPVCRTLSSWSTCVKTKCPIGIFQFRHFPL